MKKKLWEIFTTFFKIGLFTFGGGYAMISVIEDECIEKRGWISDDDMMNVLVIAESTPGPVAINCATFVGYKQAGIAGAVMGTLGVTLPSFIIILIISAFLQNFLSITWVANAFRGIKIAVGLLIINAGINMFKKMKKTVLPVAIAACAFIFMSVVNLTPLQFSSIAMMVIAGVVGWIGGLVSKTGKSDSQMAESDALKDTAVDAAESGNGGGA